MNPDNVKSRFRFAVLADPHLIDNFYNGQETSELDTKTLYLAKERFEKARDKINLIDPPVELVFINGDLIHNHPSTDLDFYEKNTTAIDYAKDVISGFKAPVYITFGNHDYDIPNAGREFTHELFKRKLGVEPYRHVDYKGWRFILLNNFLGETCDPKSPHYEPDFGSLGCDQLEWLERLLSEGKPTFVILHHPMPIMMRNELPGVDAYSLMEKYKSCIRMVLAGHTHLWMDGREACSTIPPHGSMASTRYNENAYLIFEVDTVKGKLRILNEKCIVWNSTDTLPFEG